MFCLYINIYKYKCKVKKILLILLFIYKTGFSKCDNVYFVFNIRFIFNFSVLYVP